LAHTLPLKSVHFEAPDCDFGGYIFDLDGTLVDTMNLHYAAWQSAFERAGLVGRLDENRFYELSGSSGLAVAAILSNHHHIKIDADALYKYKQQVFLASLGEMEIIEPVADFARKVSRSRPIAIASGGKRNVVLAILEKSGLASLFPIVVASDDVKNGKPSPEMFLLAADRMRVLPENCLVIEDGQPGVDAARSAGMRCAFVSSRSLS
jgi:HAD superfamily hydrolase (TIGR01509 family)